MSTVSYVPRVPMSVRSAQVVGLILAVPMALGSVMFSVITPDHRYAAWVTWLFSPVAFLAAVGLFLTAPRLGRGGEATRERMVRLLVVVAGFSVIKLSVFSETTSIPFLVLALLGLALLRTRSARRSQSPSR